MTVYGKKHKSALEKVEKNREYSIEDAIKIMKSASYAKFDESTAVSVVLGINPEKADQLVRGSLTLPHKFTKPIRIVAFAKGEQAEAAKKAGADYVGAEDLIEKIISEQWTDFDCSVATPDLMALLGKCAKILGPLGLLPNKKNNTVALNLVPIITELKNGLLFFKNDSNGQIHFNFGKISFSEDFLKNNLFVFFKTLISSKPSAARGIFIRKATLSSTMGPGIKLQVNNLIGL